MQSCTHDRTNFQTKTHRAKVCLRNWAPTQLLPLTPCTDTMSGNHHLDRAVTQQCWRKSKKNKKQTTPSAFLRHLHKQARALRNLRPPNTIRPLHQNKHLGFVFFNEWRLEWGREGRKEGRLLIRSSESRGQAFSRPRQAYAISPTDDKSDLRVLLVYQTSTKRFTAAFPAFPMSQHPLLPPINSTIPNNKPADGFLFYFTSKISEFTSPVCAPSHPPARRHPLLIPPTLYNTKEGEKGGKTLSCP